MTETLDRIAPQNLEFEQAVIGSILLEPEVLPRVCEIVKSSDFWRLGPLFQILTEMADEDIPLQLVAIRDELKRRELGELYTMPWLLEVKTSMPTGANAIHYARGVAESALRRRLIQAADAIREIAYDEDRDASLLPMECASVLNAATENLDKTEVRPMRAVLQEVMERWERNQQEGMGYRGILTGLSDLNYMTGGWQKQDLIVIAARTSVGKTSLAVNTFVAAALKEKKRVALFSLEMSADQIVDRLVASSKRISLHNIRVSMLQDHEWKSANQALGELWNSEIIIDDRSETSASGIRQRLRTIKHILGAPIDMVVIDFLTLIKPEQKLAGASSHMQVTDTTRRLKQIAREFNIPVILLAQLNREVEKRGSAVPQLSDLRESGSIEEAADIVGLLWKDRREEVGSPEVEKACLTIAKNRNGAKGDIQLIFHPAWTRFDQAAREDGPPYETSRVPYAERD